jgi:Xaa-Pro aminopeptidase
MTVQRDAAGRRRIDAVRRELERRELDLLVVFGSGRHHFIGANLCWWLSGTRQVGRDAAVVLPRDGEPVLLTSPSWDGVRGRRRGWIEDVVAVDDPATELALLVRERGWRTVRAGVAGRATASPATASALEHAFERTVADADEAVHAVASVHDELAIASIARAVEIAEAGYRHMCDVARPGMREFELAAEADAHMRALGADDNFLLISASQHNRAVHAPTDRELSRGDVILGEISPSVDGQFAQICRSAVLGEPDERQLACYAVLQEAFQAGLDRAGPGVPVPEVTRAVNAVVSAHGYERYTKPPYMRTRGHAMGLGVLVPADISETTDVALEAGMAFVLHPNQYFPEVGYLLCGDQVAITDDGARALSSVLPSLDAIAGAVVA